MISLTIRSIETMEHLTDIVELFTNFKIHLVPILLLMVEDTLISLKKTTAAIVVMTQKDVEH